MLFDLQHSLILPCKASLPVRMVFGYDHLLPLPQKHIVCFCVRRSSFLEATSCHPMSLQVRPGALLEALEHALLSLPGNQHALSSHRADARGIADKDSRAAAVLVHRTKAALSDAQARGRLAGRMIYADNNRADLKVRSMQSRLVG